MAMLLATLVATGTLGQVPGHGVPNYTVTYQMNRSTLGCRACILGEILHACKKVHASGSGCTDRSARYNDATPGPPRPVLK